MIRARKTALVARGLAAAVTLTALGVGIAAAAADVPHTGCTNVAAGTSSGWCGLYPGNATDNVRELGSVSLSSDGMTLTVQTQDSSTGVVPATSFACVTLTPASDITHRLQRTQCAAAGGVWFPIAGGTQTIDLSAYPQFQNAVVTVQVAANQDANNSNGDAFYNNVTVDTTAGGIGIG